MGNILYLETGPRSMTGTRKKKYQVNLFSYFVYLT